MKLTIISPIKAILSSYTEDELYVLRKALTYTNTAVQHDINRHYKNFFWKQRNPDSWQDHLDNLKKDLKKTLVFEEYGDLYIRPGSIPYLLDTIPELDVRNTLIYPPPLRFLWKTPLPFSLHPYQEESWQKLIEKRHGNVSLTTGS